MEKDTHNCIKFDGFKLNLEQDDNVLIYTIPVTINSVTESIYIHCYLNDKEIQIGNVTKKLGDVENNIYVSKLYFSDKILGMCVMNLNTEKIFILLSANIINKLQREYSIEQEYFLELIDFIRDFIKEKIFISLRIINNPVKHKGD